MIILLTNDDGVASEGLLSLRELLSADHDVYVVAPERQRTCVGHAITLHKPLRLRRAGDGVYGSNGTPADCVLLGVQVVLPARPDMIISGINSGPNMGQDVNYSGTVAAAKEGARLGIVSLAVSAAARDHFLYAEVSAVVGELIDILGGASMPPQVFLNVNVPNIERSLVRGFRVTRLGKRIYNDTVIERVDPRGERYYWIGGGGDAFDAARGSDFHAVQKGFVSVTPLSADGTSVSMGQCRELLAGGRRPSPSSSMRNRRRRSEA
jgi:5'-nucleotidase